MVGEPRGNLAARIDRVFREATGATHRRGAGKWIAQLARIHPQSVSRIIAGSQPSDRIEAVLDAIELGRRLGRPRKRGG